MRKLLIGSIIFGIVVLLVVFAWPFLMGSALRSQVYDLQHSEQLPAGVKVTIKSYHTGWLHSDMDLLVTVPASAQAMQALSSALANNTKANNDYVFAVHLDVVHGPIMHLSHSLTTQHYFFGRGAAIGSIQLVSPNPAQFTNLKVFQQALSVQLISNWSGTLALTIERPASIAYKNIEQGIIVTYSKFLSTTHVSRDFQHWSGDIQLKNILIKSAYNHLAIDSFTSNYNMSRGAAGLWYGQQTTTIPTITYIKQSANLAELQDIVYETSNELDANNKMIAQVKLTMKQGSLLNQGFGPFKLSLAISNLNPQSLLAIHDAAVALKAQPPLVIPSNASVEQRNNLTKKYASNNFNLLQPKLVEALTGVNIKLDTLQLTLNKGTTSLTGNLLYPVQIPGTVDDPNALKNMTKASSGSATLTVPVALAEEISEFFVEKGARSPLKALINDAYVLKQGRHYVMNFDYQHALLKLNGKTIYPMPPALRAKIIPTPPAKPSAHPKALHHAANKVLAVNFAEPETVQK